jgi:hypothetical protein
MRGNDPQQGGTDLARACEVTPMIRERFGVKSALDYLVGEKLLNFAKAADQDPDFAAEFPRFQAAVWEIFNPYELRGMSQSTGDQKSL